VIANWITGDWPFGDRLTGRQDPLSVLSEVNLIDPVLRNGRFAEAWTQLKIFSFCVQSHGVVALLA
jgi:hypothetical protein